MKLKSIIVMVLLVVAVGGYVLFKSQEPSDGVPAEGRTIFQFAPEDVTSVEAIHKDSTFLASRDEAGRWVVEKPTKWPALSARMKPLLAAVTTLHHRYAPIPATEPNFNWAQYGLAAPQLTVTVKAGGQAHKVSVGNVEGGGFNRRAYIRINEETQILEVGSDLYDVFSDAVSNVDRLRERVLFLTEEYKENEWDPKMNRRVKADEITVASQDGKFTLKRDGEKWQLTEPMKDSPDPDKLKALLKTIPTLWVEGFLSDSPSEDDVKNYGLDEPERTLTVVSGKRKVTLAIGDFSRTETYEIKKQRPQRPGQPPMGPPEQTAEVEEEFYYAKLPEYVGVFEVKTVNFDLEGEERRIFSEADLRGDVGKFEDVFVAPDEMRDKKIVRFDRWDVKHVDLAYEDFQIELKKKDYDWHIVKPVEVEAEDSTINDLLDKTKDLEVKGFIYEEELAKYGLDKPTGKLVVTTEEEKKKEGSDEKEKIKETFTVLIGKADTEAGVVYVKVEDQARVNEVDIEYLDTLKKGLLEYRSKEVLDFSKSDLVKLEVKKADDHFVVRKDGDDYKFLQPGTGEADKDKVNEIVDKLTSLKAEKYLTENASDDELKEYGLVGDPTILAVVTVKVEEEDEDEDEDEDKDDKDKKDEKKNKKKKKETTRVHRLLVGKTSESDKEHRYARLEAEKVVFTIGKDPIEKLQLTTLDLLPKELWDVDDDEILTVDIQQAEKRLKLEKADDKWRITQPVDVAAGSDEVEDLLEELDDPECERYVVLRADDLTKYGLAKPFLTVTVGVEAEEGDDKDDDDDDDKKDEDEEDEEKERKFQTYVLKIGAPEGEDKKSRFAMRSGTGASEAVFVLKESLIEQLTKDHLAYLDRELIDVDEDDVVLYESTRDGQKFALTKKDKKWLVTAPVEVKPDSSAVADLLDAVTDIEAERFAALGKVDLPAYGLDKPYLTATLTTEKTTKVPVEPKKEEEPEAEKKDEEADKDEAEEKEPEKKFVEKKERTSLTVVIGKTVADDSKERYAMLKGQEYVAVLSAGTVEKLAWNHLDLLDKDVVSIAESEVIRIETSGTAELKIEKKDDNWQITAPKQLEADKKEVDSLLSDVSPLEAEAYVAYKTVDLKKYGLDKPAVTARLVLKKDDKTETTTILVGAEAAEEKGCRYACLEGGDSVFVLAKKLTEKLTGGALAFYNRQVLDLEDDDVEQVIIARLKSSTPATFAQRDDKWKLVSPVEADAEDFDLDDLVDDLAELKVERFVAEGVKDLGQYGLAPKPYAEVTLKMKPGKAEEGKEPPPAKTHTVLVGSLVEKDGEERHGCLKGSDLVFVLDDDAVETMTEEYRERDVIDGLDASDIKELILTRETKKLHLKKDGDKWKIEGDDDEMDKDKVQEALDAISGLETERYVQDTNDNLALFGLKAPEMIIVAKTGSKEKTLHLGRAMGDTAERYAQVPGDDQHGVFLIDEDDAKKLFRWKGDFTKKD